jgi:aerobic C4-dicarboxylate transport protein
MGIARALGNLVGNCVATVAIAAWEGDIDRERARATLDGQLPATIDDGMIEEEAPALAPAARAVA